MTHPIHSIIGDVITVILCVALLVPALYVIFWAVVGAYRAAFLPVDAEPPAIERNGLESVPLGAPRDGGNYIYNGTGWVRMDEEETERVRELLKLNAKGGRLDPEGWDVRINQPDPTHPEMMLEVLNDVDGDFGPDDVEEDEIERPDEIYTYGSDRS